MKFSEKRKIAILIGIFVVIGIVYYFCTPNSVKNPGSFNYYSNAIAQNSKCIFTGGSATSDGYRVNCKRIGIFAQNKSELLEEFGKALAQQLQQQGCAEKAVFYPFGKSTGRDDIFPDQCFFITQEKFSDSLIPGCRALKSVIRIQGGNAFTRCFSMSSSHVYCFVPETQHEMTETLETEATGYSFSIGKSKYNSLAEEMGKSAAENLIKEFKKHIENSGVMPDIPESLYPAAAPSPELPFADLGEFKMLCCGRRPLAVKAVWQAEIKSEKDKLLHAIKDRLAANGWKTCLENGGISGTKSNEKIVISELGLSGLPTENAVKSNVTPVMKIYVTWEKFMPKEIAAALFEPLVKNSQSPLSLLITLSENLTDSQRRQVMKRAETSPETLDSTAWIILSRFSQDKAKEYLLKAKSAAYLEANGSSRQTTINAQLKNLGVKNPEQIIPAKEELRKLGIMTLENQKNMQVEGKLNLPLIFSFYDKDKKPAFIRLTVSRSIKNPGKYKLLFQESNDVCSSSQESDPAEICGTAAVSFKVNSADGDKVIIDVQHHTNTPANLSASIRKP